MVSNSLHIASDRCSPSDTFHSNSRDDTERRPYKYRGRESLAARSTLVLTLEYREERAEC